MENVSLLNMEFSFDEVMGWDPERVTLAGIRAESYPDGFAPRTVAQRREDGTVGEMGEMISEKVLTLIKHEEKYQDFQSEGVEVDGVTLKGIIEIKVLRENSTASLMKAIDRHLRHDKADYVISLVGDRTKRKFRFHRITYTGLGREHIKSLVKYMD